MNGFASLSLWLLRYYHLFRHAWPSTSLAIKPELGIIMLDGLGNVGDTIRSALGLVVQGAGAILNQSVVSANALFELFGSSPTSGTKAGPVFGDTGILLAVLCAAVTNDDPTSD